MKILQTSGYQETSTATWTVGEHSFNMPADSANSLEKLLPGSPFLQHRF